MFACFCNSPIDLWQDHAPKLSLSNRRAEQSMLCKHGPSTWLSGETMCPTKTRYPKSLAGGVNFVMTLASLIALQAVLTLSRAFGAIIHKSMYETIQLLENLPGGART